MGELDILPIDITIWILSKLSVLVGFFATTSAEGSGTILPGGSKNPGVPPKAGILIIA